MSDERKVGLYSLKAAKVHGTVCWKNASGATFEITAYDYPSKYRWADAQIVTSDELEYVSGRLRGSWWVDASSPQSVNNPK